MALPWPPLQKKPPKPRSMQIQDDLDPVFSFCCTDVARKQRSTSLTECDLCLLLPDLHQPFPGKMPTKL